MNSHRRLMELSSYLPLLMAILRGIPYTPASNLIGNGYHWRESFVHRWVYQFLTSPEWKILPSGKPAVCFWKWPFIADLQKKMCFFIAIGYIHRRYRNMISACGLNPVEHPISYFSFNFQLYWITQNPMFSFFIHLSRWFSHPLLFPWPCGKKPSCGRTRGCHQLSGKEAHGRCFFLNLSGSVLLWKSFVIRLGREIPRKGRFSKVCMGKSMKVIYKLGTRSILIHRPGKRSGMGVDSHWLCDIFPNILENNQHVRLCQTCEGWPSESESQCFAANWYPENMPTKLIQWRVNKLLRDAPPHDRRSIAP